MERLPLPLAGATNRSSVRDMPPGFTTFDRLRNFWPRDAADDRGRGGQRAGLSKTIATQIANGRVQSITEINLASTIDGYVIDEGTCEDITAAESRGDGTIEGNLWLSNGVPALDRHWYDSRGGGSLSVPAVCWHPDGETIYSVVNLASAVGVKAVSSDGTELWEVSLLDRDNGDDFTTGPIAVYANTLRADANFLYIAVERFIYVLRQSDGYHLVRYDFDGWSRECTGLEVRPDGKIVACFHGSNGAGSLYGGEPILGTDVNFYAADFRAGVALFSVDADTPNDPLTRETFGPQLSSTDDYFEAAHGYFRISEHMGGSPRGCYPTAIGVGTDNTVYVCRSNKGWGPNWDFPPSDDQPYYTVFKLSSTGTLLWANDTQSLRTAETISGVTYHSDRYVTDKSCQAIAVDSEIGLVYVGGAVSGDADACVFSLDTLTGALVSKCDLDTTVLQDSMSLMPKSRRIAVGGVPGTTWPDSGSERANLWLLEPLELGVSSWFDLTSSVNCGNVKANGEDQLAFGTQYVS